MLDSAMKDQLSGIFSGLVSQYVFDIQVAPDQESRQELIDLLGDVASCSDPLSCSVADGEGLQFTIVKDGMPTGIRFRAVPNGHEFTSLLLAVLNCDGKGKNIPDESICARVRALNGPIKLTTYVSLTCTNCPDVVQALNVMATLNSRITHETVDGAINQKEVEASAIYSARKGLNVAVIAERIGGQVKETVGIENLISVPQTTGQQLANDLLTHINDYPVDILEHRRVDKVELDGSAKLLTTSTGERFSAPALIVATGASWRKLNVPGEADYIGKGVAFCPHCDGPFYKGKHVAVVGGGNSGIEAAIDLAGICSKVTVLEFMDELKADQVLQEKAKSLPNVEVFLHSQSLEVLGNGDKVTGLRVKDRKTDAERVIDLDGIFVQIGLAANSGVFRDVVETNKPGEIVIDAHCRTNVPGIYAAGDVSTVPYKQIIIAMGEGAKAALSAFEDRMRGLIG